MMLAVLLGLSVLFTLIVPLGVFAIWKLLRNDNSPLPIISLTGFFFVAACVLWLIWAHEYDQTEKVAQRQRAIQAEDSKGK